MAATEDLYDYVIVGAGSAGCALANRLSADPANRVLLLEAGPRDTNPWIHIPVGYFKTMHNPKTDWCFVTEPDPGLDGRALQWPRGRVLGGSSSLNGLLYIRGQAEDYDHWRQLGNAGWSYDDVLPYFIRAEDQERGTDDFHGVGGPLTVSNNRMVSELGDAIIAAATEVGIPANDDFNGACQEGVGYFQVTIRNGLRCSAAVGYLRPVKDRRNLRVVTDSQVEAVTIRDNRATGVRYRRGGATVRANAGREVILSAGAIGSPHLLMLSGIGPAAMLRSFDVDVIRDLPGVGANLQDHLQIRAIYGCAKPITLNDQMRNPLRKMWAGIEFALLRRGPLTLAASQVCIFCRSRPELERPDIQFHIQPLSADSPGEGLHKFSAFTFSVTQLRPESRGRIELTSPDPTAHPAIVPNYLSTPTDRQVAVDSLKMARRIAAAPALAPYVSEEIRPGPEARTDDDLLHFARTGSTTIYHPVGTCKMGQDQNAVVDERLRVHGVDGLRVVDASIMPTLVSGNTNAPAIMIGEKAADMILEDARGG